MTSRWLIPAANPAANALASRGDPRWEVVGFHRPLSGFFYNYLLSLLVMIPFNFVFTFYIERNYVNPFLEARGAWGAVTQFMGFFFALLDLGTGQAMVKYFAEYRVRDPGRAITYAQFYIWFHALGGVLAVTILGIMAAIFMPETFASIPNCVAPTTLSGESIRRRGLPISVNVAGSLSATFGGIGSAPAVFASAPNASLRPVAA